MNPVFNRAKYVIRKKVFSLLGTKFHIYDDNSQLVLYSEMEAFKLKEAIHLYSDESMSLELLRIQARNIVDLHGVYDVIDTESGENLGSFRRRGFKSILKDEWIIYTPQGAELGRIKEDNSFLALLRRFIHIIPQNYSVEIGGRKLPTYQQNINPLVTKVNIDLAEHTGSELDPRMGIAAGILLCSIEGKQN